MEGASRNVADFYNHVAALDEFSRCMDPQFKDIKNWELFAFGLGVPADVIRICKLYSEYSPTIRLFEYLKLTRPDMTISDLSDALTRNKQRARFDLHRLLKDAKLGNELKISEAITNSTSDIMDNIAFKLDSASAPTCTWIDFGLELGITRDKLHQFEMYTNYNPTEALLRYVYTASAKPVKASAIVGYLEKMDRRSILDDIEAVTQSADMSDIAAQDIFKLGSELLVTISRELNEDHPGVGGWRVLASHLIADHYVIDPHIISKLEPPHPQEIHSPTKKVIEWLSANKPDVTINELITKCEEIDRNDAVKILIGHYSRAVEVSDDDPVRPPPYSRAVEVDDDDPVRPPPGQCVQETIITTEHILKYDVRSFGLPKQTTKMIGREEKKEELVKEILRQENRLVVLHAATGYGKETLAVETAYELIEIHNYTCIYVDSDGILTVEDLAIKILTTCGIPAPSAGEKEKLKELLKTVTRECLLILDNFDHVFHTDDKRRDSMDTSTSSADMPKPKRFLWQDLTRKEEYQVFLEDLLKYASTWTILATTWESFSVANAKEVELTPLTPSESEELLLSRCESVHGIERSSISSDQLKAVLEFCSNIPQLICNAAVIVKTSVDDSFASSPPERKLTSVCRSDMSPKQRFHPCVSVCFDRLRDISQKVLMVISVLPGFFTLDEAASIFSSLISNKEELQDGLTDLINFSFLSYNQERKVYYLSPAMRSFVIYKVSQEPPTSSETDSNESDLSLTYKGAISRFVYYTFDSTLKIENNFFSTCSANAIQRYRKQEANLKEIANWCISDRLSKDTDMKRLRYHIISSFIQCYLVNIKMMEPNLLKTILCRFSRFCLENKRRDDGTKKKSAKNGSEKEYIECLTYGGVTCILGCLCVPQLCPTALEEAMWCFNKVLRELCTSHSSVIPSLSQQLGFLSKCKIMTKGAQTQFLLKYGKCLVRHGRMDEGLEFVKKGVEIREKVFKKSKSTKDRVMVAVGYNDLASAYSYNNDSNGTAIQIRQTEVLPVYTKYLGCHPFTASALSHLAHDYLTLDLYDEALKACEKALSYRKRLLGEHSETARSLFDMGRILREQACHCNSLEDKHKRYEEALSYLFEALEMRQHLAFTPKETAQTHSEIADVLKSLGRNKEAQKHVEIARVHVKKPDSMQHTER